MHLVFALGNPGKDYEETYHNAGILALTSLQETIVKETLTSYKPQGHFAYAKQGDWIFGRVNPEAEIYMNQSGIAVSEALAYFKLSPKDLMLIHDDSDLPLGSFKLETNRGAAGHHGVESVMDALQTNEFLRGRIGIRPPETDDRRRKAEEFVLKHISPEDREKLEKAARKLGEKIVEQFHA